MRQELTLKNKPPSDEGGGTAPAVTEGENTATCPAGRFGSAYNKKWFRS